MQPARRQQRLQSCKRTLLFAGAPARSPPVIFITLIYKLNISNLQSTEQQYGRIRRVLYGVCFMACAAKTDIFLDILTRSSHPRIRHAFACVIFVENPGRTAHRPEPHACLMIFLCKPLMLACVQVSVNRPSLPRRHGESVAWLAGFVAH